MPKFSEKSQSNLSSCDDDLQKLFNLVVQGFDCTIIEGHRGEESQNEKFRTGKSKVKYPRGKHNVLPSKAVDVAPYPIDWNDRERFTYFAGYVKAKAEDMGFRVRWGGDWNSDWEVKDNGFDDLVHFELL
jgi:peptidoglycan L-alanyl-D-glutamate endopeptidase CwlK